MSDLIRDAPIGQILRWVTGRRILKYPEERDDFQIPSAYTDNSGVKSPQSHTTSTTLPVSPYSPDEKDLEKANSEPAEEPRHNSVGVDRHDLERFETQEDFERRDSQHTDIEKVTTTRSQLSRSATRSAFESIHTRAELEEAIRVASLAKAPTTPIVPERTHDGLILVDFYTTDDPENPQAWSSKKKFFASLQIYLYTMAVYMGSAIYSPSVEGVMEDFHVGITAASLGLALYGKAPTSHYVCTT